MACGCNKCSLIEVRPFWNPTRHFCLIRRCDKYILCTSSEYCRELSDWRCPDHEGSVNEAREEVPAPPVQARIDPPAGGVGGINGGQPGGQAFGAGGLGEALAVQAPWDNFNQLDAEARRLIREFEAMHEVLAIAE